MRIQPGVVEGHSLPVPRWRWSVSHSGPSFPVGLLLGRRGIPFLRCWSVPTWWLGWTFPSFAERVEMIFQPFSQLVERLQSREELVNGFSSSCLQDSSRSHLDTVPEDCVLGKVTLGASVPPSSSSAGAEPPTSHQGRRGRRESWDSPSDSSTELATPPHRISAETATVPVIWRRKGESLASSVSSPAQQPESGPTQQLASSLENKSSVNPLSAPGFCL
ncbi:uncharacterized protein LOC130555313 [Triplophysa rosa]|uniref:uncharacterized protein LOC130555313 n=1 Tax=Triplophysa rosa TaxID=992332 RepID=UPI0025461B9C|nr:uncharacterized protein LOC130555313 [Triplophysa rosa]